MRNFQNNFGKSELKIILLFLISMALFLRVFEALTWFEDELRGHWFIKRLIFASMLSIGYLAQYPSFKFNFPKTSKVLLIFSLTISLMSSLLCGINIFLMYLVINIIFFYKGQKNALA